jgi:hypothetical protein
MKTKELKSILERVETWPENAQKVAIQFLRSIEEEIVQEEDVLQWSHEAQKMRRAGKLPLLRSLRSV